MFVRALAADLSEHRPSSEALYEARQEEAEPNTDISAEVMTSEHDADEGQQKHPSGVSSHFTSVSLPDNTQ